MLRSDCRGKQEGGKRYSLQHSTGTLPPMFWLAPWWLRLAWRAA